MKTNKLNRPDILQTINVCLNISSLDEIRIIVQDLCRSSQKITNENNGLILIKTESDIIEYSHNLLLKEIEQIINTKTIERTKYYLKRLVKSLSEKKIGKVNDLNLNRWKEYDDLLTDSLWIFDKRDTSGVHKAGYWGNFIPQIPNQLLRRFTKKGEWALDPFLGSGTTLIECKRLGNLQLSPFFNRVPD